MTQDTFIYWLKGFFAGKSVLVEEQVNLIKEGLQQLDMNKERLQQLDINKSGIFSNPDSCSSKTPFCAACSCNPTVNGNKICDCTIPNKCNIT